MNYQLIQEVIELIEKFDKEVEPKSYRKDLSGFKRWIHDNENETGSRKLSGEEPAWEGKENGRSPESVINTLIVHMNRYAKTYSKSAMHDSGFSTQEDFIYLINLKAFGAMTKTDLIKKNIQEKPVGMQIINRLINKGWILQNDSLEDKRSKIMSISREGIKALDQIMEKIRQASKIVTGNLSHLEKLQLIKLLQKLEYFHQPIFSENIDSSQLVDKVYQQYMSPNNSKKS